LGRYAGPAVQCCKANSKHTSIGQQQVRWPPKHVQRAARISGSSAAVCVSAGGNLSRSHTVWHKCLMHVAYVVETVLLLHVCRFCSMWTHIQSSSRPPLTTAAAQHRAAHAAAAECCRSLAALRAVQGGNTAAASSGETASCKLCSAPVRPQDTYCSGCDFPGFCRCAHANRVPGSQSSG
jgi:hypothetical protein